MRPRKKSTPSVEQEETMNLEMTENNLSMSYINSFLIMVAFLKGMADERDRRLRTALTRLEELDLPEDTYREVRKILLDVVNDYYRSMFTVLAKNIE